MAQEFKSFTSVSEAARELQEFLFDRDAAIPDDLREQLKALVGPTTSPVDTVVRGSELIYARRDELDPKVKALAAGMALVAQQYNFHGMAEEDRGSKMALAMMRDAKVKKPTTVTYPAKDKDPPAKSEYLPVPQPTPPPELDTDVEDTPTAEGSRRGRGTRNKNAINTS